MFIRRQAGRVRWARSPRWDCFYRTFIWNLLSQFKQKVCYVDGKKLFDQVVFTINSDVKPLCRTNLIILSNWYLKNKRSWLLIIENYSAMPGWLTCACSYGKCSSCLGGISSKSREISPGWAGSLLIWTHYIVIRVYLRKVRSHLGEPACLTKPAHLHMSSPIMCLSTWWVLKKIMKTKAVIKCCH